MTKLSNVDTASRYKRHRFPAEIIAHAVWLYYRFPLSLRDVEDLLAERGIDVSFQTVCEWTAKFGYQFADQLRRRSRGNFADKWHLDEMVVSIKGKKYWLWRAVDADGYVLDALLQSRRNRKAALRLMRKLLKSQGIKTRGSFPTDDAATKLIYLAIRNFEKDGRNVREWFAARNQFAIVFGERFAA